MPSTPLSPEDLAYYSFPDTGVKDLLQWRDEDSYYNLIDRHDGPFGGYGTVGKITHDGKQWVRMQEVMSGGMVDLELKPNGYIGQVVPVPAEEAARIAHERGATPH